GELLKRRGDTQPVQSANAGSVFTNPPGDHAARLIESSGLKGLAVGGARVSDKHANFIVNTGNATAADIERLIALVRARVAASTGVELTPEVRIGGEADDGAAPRIDGQRGRRRAPGGAGRDRRAHGLAGTGCARPVAPAGALRHRRGGGGRRCD